MTDESLWTSTTDTGYMAEDQRAEHPSHSAVEEFLRSHYGEQDFNLLDCGVMSGITYDRLLRAKLSIEYTGIDISDAILRDCRVRRPEATWLRMSVTDIGLPDDSFDVVYARHLLECLPYYETAVREMFRVARKHVVLCLFHVPREPEVLLRRTTPDGYLWLNRYAPGPFEALLDSLSEDVVSVDVNAGRRPNRVYLCTKGG